MKHNITLSQKQNIQIDSTCWLSTLAVSLPKIGKRL